MGLVQVELSLQGAMRLGEVEVRVDLEKQDSYQKEARVKGHILVWKQI